MTLLADTTTALHQSIDNLLTFLKEIVGVTDERIQNIRDRFHTEEPLKLKQGEPIEIATLSMSAIHSSQIYSRCCLDTPKLIQMCKDVWESLSARNHAAKQYLSRKLTLMKADPKADPDVLATIEVLKSDYGK